MELTDEKPVVFLSSASGALVPLRQRILEGARSLAVDLWAYEYKFQNYRSESGLSTDTLVERCFKGIEQSDLFVFILTDRHGTRTAFAQDSTFVTYLELELLAAAIFRKPILVLHSRDCDPAPPLQDCMALLQEGFGSKWYQIDSDAGLYDTFVRACEYLSEQKPNFAPANLSAPLPEWLSRSRSKGTRQNDLTDPELQFFRAQFPPPRAVANLDSVASILDNVAAGTLAEGGVMTHGAGLSQLWAALRELINDFEATQADPAAGRQWDRLLGLWSSKASWFGLHGHVWMGPLAAINSQIQIRRRFSGEPAFSQTGDVREPVGARASALYSLAQNMHTWKRKQRHFRQALSLACEAVERDPSGSEGALSIRAHTLMRLAMLGEVWKMYEASRDFRRSLELREAHGGSERAVGEAKVDWGFCLVLTGRLRTGLALMQEGIGLMRYDESANGKAFLARGLRKLETAARILHKKDLAELARAEAASAAKATDALDQLRRL